MAELEKSSLTNSSPLRPADYTSRGELVEEAERRHVSGPLTREQFLAFLLKTGKVPPGTELKQAS